MSTSIDFDWNKAPIVQRDAYQLAIYDNPYGDIVIRQQRQWDEESDTIIIIAKGNAATAAHAILKAAGHTGLHEEDFDDNDVGDADKPKDRIAAERQRRRRANKPRRDRAAVTVTDGERDIDRDGDCDTGTGQPSLRLIAGE